MSSEIQLNKKLMEILAQSRLLNGKLPPVRIYALRETLRFAVDNEKAISVLIDNVQTSPHIPQEKKEPLANMLFEGDWDRLKSALDCVDGASEEDNADDDDGDFGSKSFISFRQCVASIFSTSRRLSGVPTEIKRRLGASIYNCGNVEELKALCYESLVTSTAFVDSERDTVANHVLDDRYDLLILTDLFDCEIGARRAAIKNTIRHTVSKVTSVFHRRLSGGGGDDNDASAPPYQDNSVVDDNMDSECPICLGSRLSDVVLPTCKHIFCRACLEEWLETDASCPMCRASINRQELNI